MKIVNKTSNFWGVVAMVIAATALFISLSPFANTVISEVGEKIDNLGGTRFPNGISADNTTASAGQVRGTTITSTGAATLASASITGAATVGTTLGVTGASTFASTIAVTGTTTMATSTVDLITGGIASSATSTSAQTVTLLPTDSGKLIFIGTTGDTYTLPAVTNTGAHFKFIVGVAFSTNFVIDSAEGDNIEGGLTVNSLAVPCVGEDQINFVAASEELGDWVELYSDGTSWLIAGSDVVTTVSMTCTDPS